MKTRHIAFILIALCAFHGAQAEVYRWVDKNGKVHYSDNPPAEVDAQRRSLQDNRVEQDKLPYTTRKAAERFPLTLLTSESCGEPCTQARNLLNKRKAPFREQVLKEQADLDRYKLQLGKKELISPTLIVGTRALDGFEATRWSEELDAAAYPK